MLDTVLVIGGLICFGLDTFKVPTKFNLTAAGLFLWLLTVLV